MPSVMVSNLLLFFFSFKMAASNAIRVYIEETSIAVVVACFNPILEITKLNQFKRAYSDIS